MNFRLLVAATLCAACVARAPAAPAGAAPQTLAFRIDEGQNINSFLRDGAVAAHLLLRSGDEPRILVAFPAGNSGVGLWFARTSAPASWTLTTAPRPVSLQDHGKRTLRGIEFEVRVDAPELRVQGVVLSSIRVLRDYELQCRAPGEVLVAPRVAADGLAWARDRLDGTAGYELRVTVLDGGTATAEALTAAPGATVHLKIRALTGDTPLTPLRTLLTERAGDDARARNVLAFLSYREKFLAGSWRFDTYFGRDTEMSALLLAPVLEPDAMESAISSVLERLAPDGEVAHEEDIGEFAVLRNAREGRGYQPRPVYDYGMVDDDFMLAPLAARWLLDDARGRGRAAAFLAQRTTSGERVGAALVRNLAWLVERAAPFADDPRATNLVGIKAGRMTGDWRDSEQGLGRGRYPYDINAALVPAALDATARLFDAGVLQRYLGAAPRRVLAQARARAEVWSMRAPGLFAVRIARDPARAAVERYAREVGVDSSGAGLAPGEAALEFQALSLDEQGRPVPIVNSDEGFRLLLMNPSADELGRCLTILRPFPLGLLTDAGLLVANPAQAGDELRREFTRFAYHGTVVWSWQQALLAAGLARQLQRTDLPAALRDQLVQSQAKLWSVIEANRAMRTSELWSWSYAAGHYHAEPFGRPGADVDESNAAQLWSTVYLGLAPH